MNFQELNKTTKFFCLNCFERRDRYINSLTEFKKNNLEVQYLFSRLNFDDPETGSGTAHLNAIKKAKELGLEKVVIFEDDVEFIDCNFDEPPDDYDICFFGGIKIEVIEKLGFWQEATNYCAHAYMIKSVAFDRIISTYEKASMDVLFHNLQNQRMLKSYCSSKNIVIQKKDYSDLKKQVKWDKEEWVKLDNNEMISSEDVCNDVIDKEDLVFAIENNINFLNYFSIKTAERFYDEIHVIYEHEPENNIWWDKIKKFCKVKKAKSNSVIDGLRHHKGLIAKPLIFFAEKVEIEDKSKNFFSRQTFDPVYYSNGKNLYCGENIFENRKDIGLFDPFPVVSNERDLADLLESKTICLDPRFVGTEEIFARIVKGSFKDFLSSLDKEAVDLLEMDEKGREKWYQHKPFEALSYLCKYIRKCSIVCDRIKENLIQWILPQLKEKLPIEFVSFSSLNNYIIEKEDEFYLFYKDISLEDLLKKYDFPKLLSSITFIDEDFDCLVIECDKYDNLLNKYLNVMIEYRASLVGSETIFLVKKDCIDLIKECEKLGLYLQDNNKKVYFWNGKKN